MDPVIGVPRALLYHTYWPFYQRFFGELGLSLRVSPATDRSILEAGTRESTGDTCLPVKLHLGHCRSLAGRVDLLFTPRVVSVLKRTYLCPKIIGLPDITRAAMDLPPVLDPLFDIRKPLRTLNSFYRLGKTLGRPTSAIVRAFRQALPLAVPASPDTSIDDAPSSSLRVGVVGHKYLIHDDFISMRLLHRLRSMGVTPLTIDDIPAHQIAEAQDDLHKPLFWSSSRDMVGTGLHFLRSGQVDGIIMMVAFACGTDSFATELMERRARDRDEVPLLILTLDEHTGEAGFLTRIEAFIDLLQRRRALS